jgi:HK97 gp10 family phage protein
LVSTVRVQGLQPLGEALKRLTADVSGKAARQATAAAARVVRNAARAAAPKKTGALRAGIVIKRERQTDLTAEYVVTISTREMLKYVDKSRNAIVELQGPIAPRVVNGRLIRPKKLLARKETWESYGDLFYGRFAEFGTVKQTPTPFMRPALDQNVQQAIDAMATSLRKSIEKAQSS